jgi:hypothetical protein
MASNTPITESQLLRTIEDLIQRALPEDWKVKLTREPGGRQSRPDGVLDLTSPGGERATFIIEAKRSLTASTLLAALDQLTTYVDASDAQVLPLLAAGYLSPRSQEVLIARGVSFADSTGNLRLSATRPGLFMSLAGATKDPWPDDQPLRSLKGRGAGRAMRALLDFRPPYGVRELAARAQASPATLSRVIEVLERDGVLNKSLRGGVEDLDWAAAIRRWSQDYELRRSNSVSTYLDPRGLSALEEKLSGTKWRYAATTSLAAQRFAPIAPTRTAVVYVDDALKAADLLKLRPADAGANVLLVEPFDAVVFERTMLRDELVTASPAQVAVDLLTGPGREPSEGEELLDWMKENEDVWRA